MKKADYAAWGARKASNDYANGLSFHLSGPANNWRERAYQEGYQAAWDSFNF